MANFIVLFPLKVEKYQEDILDKRFEIGRRIYNSLVNVTQKRYKEMIKTKKYRNLLSSLSGDKRKDKPIWREISDIRKEYGLLRIFILTKMLGKCRNILRIRR